MKTRGRKVTMFVLTMILAVGMIGSSVFAATSQVTQNPAGDGDTTTESRMAKSSHIGYLTLDKVYERYGTKWPSGQENFKYEIAKERFWDNSHKNTDENGTEKTKNDMPNPVLTGAKNPATELVRKTAGSDDVWVATVPVDDSDNVADAPDGVVSTKVGEKQVTFNFTRPGYYVYSVTEQDDQIPGVTYDKHKYYICFYVANLTEEGKKDGETLGGDEGENGDNLYVHTITAWRVEAKTGTNQQIFESIVIPQAVDPSFKTNNEYYVKVEKGKENWSTAQNESDLVYYACNPDGSRSDTVVENPVNGTAYWVKVTQEEVDAVVARGEIGKVDRSQNEEQDEDKKVGPNCLEINFWNETDSKDVELVKKVTGTLGDLQKEFEFTVTLTNLQKDSSYKISTTTGADLANTKVEGLTKDGNDYYVKTGANETSKTFKVVLKGNQSIKIEGLPVGATYTVSEAASDHVASYKVESEGFEYTLQDGDTAASLTQKGYRLVVMGANNKITDIRAITAEDLEGKTKIKIVKLANYKKGNEQNGTALALEAAETVDAGDGAVTITYTNHRDIETETGIPNFVWPIALAGILALIALAVVRRRKNVATVNDFEF